MAIYTTIVIGLLILEAGVQLFYFTPGLFLGFMVSIALIKSLKQPKYPIVLGGLIIPIAVRFISLAMQLENQILLNCMLGLTGRGCGLTVGSLITHLRLSSSLRE